MIDLKHLMENAGDTFDKACIFKPKDNHRLSNTFPSTTEVWDDGMLVTKQIFRKPVFSKLEFIKDHRYIIGRYDHEEGSTFYSLDLDDPTETRWFSTASTIYDSETNHERADEFTKFIEDNNINLVPVNEVLKIMED